MADFQCLKLRSKCLSLLRSQHLLGKSFSRTKTAIRCIEKPGGITSHHYFSTASQLQQDIKKNDAPIQFSKSPLVNYKSSLTFGGKKIEKEPSAKPLIIGIGLFAGLIYILFYLKEDSFDPFSKEVMERIQQKMLTDDAEDIPEKAEMTSSVLKDGGVSEASES